MEAMDTSCYALNMMTTPEILPTAEEVANVKRRKSEIEKVTLKVSRDPENLDWTKGETRKAQDESHDSEGALFRFIDLPSDATFTSNQFDDVPLRIIVVDLVKLYHASQLFTIPKDESRGRILQNFGVKECVDNLWSV